MGLSIQSTDNYHISDYTRAKESDNVTDRQLVTHKWRQHREKKRRVLSHQQHTAPNQTPWDHTDTGRRQVCV